MTDKEILEFSQKTKSDATALLKRTDLIKILSQFGQVIIGGSYKYDLMWGADIDITVICQDTRKSSLAALNNVVQARLA